MDFLLELKFLKVPLLFLAVERAGNIARQADVIAALTLEVLKGTTTAFESGEVFVEIKNISLHTTWLCYQCFCLKP